MEKGGPDAYIANAAGGAAHDAASNAATNASRGIFFDKGMIKSKEILLKLGEIVTCIIAEICIGCAYNSYVTQASFLNFISSTGIVLAIFLSVLYIMHIREKIAAKLRMNLVEMCYAAIWCFFFLAGSTAAVVHGRSFMYQEALIAAGFFGYIAMVLYGIDAFLMLHMWRSGKSAANPASPPQVTTPAY